MADRLAQAAADASTVVLGQVLSGMGGVGKTQLAADHARRALQEGGVQVVVWVEAGSRASVVSTYAQAARAVAAVDPGVVADADELAQTFLSWLRTTPRRWLVVLDDAAPPSGENDAPLGLEYLEGLWPPDHTGPAPRAGFVQRAASRLRGQGSEHWATCRTLVTTRRKDAALASANRTVVDVEVFTPAESTAFLARTLHGHGIDCLEEEVLDLAEDLGHLPLALAQAAAYIADEHLDVSAYRERLADQQRRLDELVPEQGSLPTGHARTVAATLALSVDHADRMEPAGMARPLIQVLSLLGNEAVPVRVLTAPAMTAHLTHRAAKTGETSHGCTDKAVERVQSAMGVLRRLSLASAAGAPKTEQASVLVHALAQRAARESLLPDQRDEAARAAADALSQDWPEVERDAAYCHTLRNNTAALYFHASDALWEPDGHPVLFTAGISLGEAGQVRAAVDYWTEMARQATTRLGPDHSDTLTSRHNLAIYTAEAGDPAAARDQYTHLVSDCTRFLGPDHPQTLTTRHGLANTTGAAGDPAAARDQYTRLLSDRIRILGPDHPDTLGTRHNLAQHTGEAGDLAAARDQYTRLLSDRIRILGPDHPQTLLTRHQLALYTSRAGDPAAARDQLTHLLTDRIRILGPDHPNTLGTRHQLADSTGAAGNPAAARDQFADLLSDVQRILGPDHPHTLATRHHLASCTAEAGDPAAARDQYTRLLAERIRILGPNHPKSLGTRHEIARCTAEAGDPATARDQLTDLLGDVQRILGPDHPNTLATRHHLASCIAQVGDPATARDQYTHLVADCTRILGPTHPDTLATRLAAVSSGAETPEAHHTQITQLLTDHAQILGRDHPQTLAALELLQSEIEKGPKNTQGEYE